MYTLNPVRSVFSVLGCICQKAELLRQPTIILNEKDFQQKLHQVIYTAINNIVFSDYEVKSVTAIDIDNYLSQYPKYYKVYEEYNGFKFISNAIEQSNIETFLLNYNRVKKFALLRHYDSNGFKVDDLFDVNETDFVKIDEAMSKIDSMTEDDIIQHYTLKTINAKDGWDRGATSESFMIGECVDSVIDELGEQPVYGSPFMWNKYFNTIFRGKLRGRLLLNSGDTGSGKSREYISNAVECSVDRYYDFETKSWISSGICEPTLYISTELEKQEIITLALAHLTGISQSVLENGRDSWSEDVKRRVEEGKRVLKKAPLYMEVIKDFSIADIDMLIEKYIVEKNVVNVFFDYIQIAPKMVRTTNELFGTTLRNDEILSIFTGQLKELCDKHQVFMESGTQLNREQYYDAKRLAGGKATANKIDQGKLVFKINQELLSNVQKSLKANPQFKTPNYVHCIYKNRKGLDYIMIWTSMNLGNYREEVCFITDYNYNIITNIEPRDLEVVDEEIEEGLF